MSKGGSKVGRKGSSPVTGRDGGAAKDPEESYSYDDEEDEDDVMRFKTVFSCFHDTWISAYKSVDLLEFLSVKIYHIFG